MMRKCSNCANRAFSSWGGMIDCCTLYEMATTEDEEILGASDCDRYEEGTPYCLTEEARHANDRDEWDDLWDDRARSVGARRW